MTRRLSPLLPPLLLTLSFCAAGAPGAGDDELPALATSVLPAAGHHQTVLTVPRAGRYALVAESRQGTALQLVDRLAGPGETAGRAGREDGRLDLLLDRGEYLVRTRGARDAAGEVRLAVRPFVELAETPRWLAPLQPVAAELGDLEQRSYWLRIGEHRRLAIEAAGRHLRDLVLWRDGLWRVGAEQESRLIEPRSGRPLFLCRLAAELEPGIYRLTAYGGAQQPWADDDGGRPLHLRLGTPRLPEAGRSRREVSPFGFDRFRIAGRADFVRLELPEAREARLEVGGWDPASPFAHGRAVGRITEESTPPVVELVARRSGREELLVTVTAEAGQPYLLQHFAATERARLRGSGPYWIATVDAGDPRDALDATALLFRDGAPGPVAPVAAQVVAVGPGRGWWRRANVLEPSTLFLRVTGAGRYQAVAAGVDARLRIEPLLLSPPRGYQPPPLRESGSVWELEPGYHLLTVEPGRPGVAELALHPEGLAEPPGGGGGPTRAAIRLAPVVLDGNAAYTLLLSHRPEVRSGVLARPLPLQLDEPLPLALAAGETVELPLATEEPAIVRARAEDGSLLELTVDGGAAAVEPLLPPGTHRVTVVNGSDGVVLASLGREPLPAVATPLPPTAAELPELPRLTLETPVFFDLARREGKGFLIAADEGGLYRLETTGLLATSAVLRTRVLPSLAGGNANGVGRNVRLESYLRPGDYQVTVRTEGESAGHLGLRLSRTAVRDGGRLVAGTPARGPLAAGEAVAYAVRVEERGRYRFRALGAAHPFAARLEDGDGWPVTGPLPRGEYRGELEPGDYRWIVLPAAVAARHLTLFERLPDPLRFAGHGPHDLPLETVVSHLWLEPEAGEARTPDVWRFTLPAAADATVTLSEGVRGDLVALPGGGDVAVVPPERGWTGRLAAGGYELRVTASRLDNRRPYRVEVAVRQLLPGAEREVDVPAVVPLSVGREGLVEVGSFGAADVRARLTDPDGRALAANDDRPGDWNFLVAAHLAAGEYRLAVEPVGAPRARTRVFLRTPEERPHAPLELPAAETLELGGDVHLLPLTLDPGAEALVLAAHSAETVGLALEAAVADGGWETVAARLGDRVWIALPLAGATDRPAYRLRLWAPDRRGNPVELAAAAGVPARIDERRLAHGVHPAPLPGGGPPVGVVAVDLERPGCFALAAPAAVEVATAPGHAALPVQTAVAAPGTTLLLVADVDAGAPPVAARRLVLDPADPSPLRLGVPAGAKARCDVAAGDGVVAAVATAPGREAGVAWGEGPGDDLDRRLVPGHQGALALDAAGGGGVLSAWIAGGDAAVGELELRLTSFPTSAPRSVGWGTAEGELDAGESRSLALPAGAKRLRLTLSAGVAAVLSAAGRPAGVVWADGGPSSEGFDSVAERLDLVLLAAERGSYSAELLPLEAVAAGPSPGRPVERRTDRAGGLRFPLAGGGALHVRGAEEVVAVGGDGSIARGSDVTVPAAGGTLLVHHRPGCLLAWVGEAAEGLGELASAPTAPLTLPALVPLSGRRRGLEIAAGGPRMLHLRSATPLVTLLERPEAPPRVEVHPQGTAVDAYLPAGAARLFLRGIPEGELSGVAELTASEVPEIGEGVGPEVLLAPGETRAFRFRVAVAATIGLGVRAAADVVDAALLDAAGEELGRGVVQMHDLEPGSYLFALTLPPGASPTRARAVVVGLEPPAGPPEEVVRHYLELAGERPAANGDPP